MIMLITLKIKKRKDNKKEEKNKRKLTVNFPIMTLKMVIKLTFVSVMLKLITEEKIKYLLQSKFTTHLEEDQIFNSVESFKNE